MEMQDPACPRCKSATRQVKAGLSNGSQQYKCGYCQRRYVSGQRRRGYSEDLRRQALELRARGVAVHQIGEDLGVTTRTLGNWFRDAAASPRPDAESEGSQAVDLDAPREQTTLGKRRSTIHDVAERAGVAVSTVSNYINKKGRMGQEARDRINAAMEALHFTPNALVRAIHQRRTRIIGAVMFGPWDVDESVGFSPTPPIMRGVHDGADEAAYNLLVYTGWPDHPERFTGLNFLDGHIDGLLWIAPQMSEPMMERAAEAGLPVVALLTRHVPGNVGFVNADNLGAMHVVVAHLAALGHRRIGYLGPAHNSNYLDRRDGFRKAMSACGLERHPALEAILSTSEPWLGAAHSPNLERLLAVPDRPSAIVVADSGWAAWSIERIRARGLRVPEDIAVTGFDDGAHAERFNLTTIHQPFREIGKRAAERLIALIEGAPVSECRITLPTELTVRASTVANAAQEAGCHALGPE